VARFLTDVTAHGFAYSEARGEAGIVMHDPLAVGVALDPSLVRLEPLRVDVETRGHLTRGLTLADRRAAAPGRGARPNCRAALDVDAARFERLFLERLCPASA
jgi:inosine-uridine nucleoside N-ribohydrolase